MSRAHLQIRALYLKLLPLRRANSIAPPSASETDLTDFCSSHRSSADLNLKTVFLELHAPNGKYGRRGCAGNINGK